MSAPPARRIGFYEILAPLGQGGMAEVFKARDVRLDRIVALKILPPSMAKDPGALERFEFEARAASALNHPNIVTVFDVGEEGGSRYIAMEFVEGRSVRELIAEGPLPVKLAVGIAAQVADGLARAHEAGIIHRDLKPENLMLNREGVVKLLDFGLAKRPPRSGSGGSAGSGGTMPGLVVGTASYMSPEQARGEEIDHRSDQFSLALVLYEMLAGRKAFEAGSVVQTLTAIIETEPPPLSSVAPQVPAPLRWLVERGLDKEASGRWDSTRDLARELRMLQGRFPELSTVVSRTETAGVRRRGKAATWLLSAGMAGAALGFSLALLFRSQNPGPPPSMRVLTYSGADSSPASAPGGETVAFCSWRDGTPRIWIKNLKGGAEAPLTAGPDDLPRFSPDGSQVLFVRKEGLLTSVFRVPVVGGEPRKLVSGAFDADWSPDGKRIAFVRWEDSAQGRSTVLGFADPAGGEAQPHKVLENVSLQRPRFSPDGRWIALVGSPVSGLRAAVTAVAVEGGEVRNLTEPSLSLHYSGVSWLPSGRGLLSLQTEASTSFLVNPGHQGQLVLLPFGRGRARTLLHTASHSFVVEGAGEGRAILETRTHRGRLREFSIDGRTSRRLTNGNSIDRQPVFSPDGKTVLFSSNRTGNWEIWSLSENGALTNLTDHPSDDWDPAFSNDGTRILWSSNRLGWFEIWSANADGTDARQITHNGVDAENPTASPDASWIVYNSTNPKQPGVFKIRPNGTQEELLVAGRTLMPEMSPDGSHVLFVASAGLSIPVVRVCRLHDGQVLPFEIEVRSAAPAVAGTGRARWMPDGKGIAFVGGGPSGMVVHVVPFTPDAPAVGPRPLVNPPPDVDASSFGISPDGTHVVIEGQEVNASLVLVEGLPSR